jgi:two-component system phosphate regulon sensor histidine kinase PhoR
MTLALLGLVSVQYYWLNTSVSVNEERFKNNVHDVLKEVAHKLEALDTVKASQRDIGSGISILHDSSSVEIDSAGNVRWQEEKLVRSRQIIGTDRLSAEGYAYEIEEEMLITKSGIARRNRIVDLKPSELKLFDETKSLLLIPDTLANSKRRDNERWLSVMRHSEMSSAMLEEMVSASKGLNIYDRLSENLLDSLLDIELADRGINSPYQFGVRDMEISPDSLMFSNVYSSAFEQIIKDGFTVRMFPTSPFGTRSLLYLNFTES